jgi:hypothetical protein
MHVSTWLRSTALPTAVGPAVLLYFSITVCRQEEGMHDYRILLNVNEFLQ